MITQSAFVAPTDPNPAAGPAVGASDLAALCRQVAAISPHTTVEGAADLLLTDPALAGMLCLPVVHHGRPVGVLSRHELNNIFLHRYGRELHGGRAVERVMNSAPLVVDLDTPLEQAAHYVTEHIRSPLTEDFVLVRDGQYVGMGVVLDLLSALQSRVQSHSQQLGRAYAQLKSSQTQLVQSEKMASLGQMVAGVAHEINTPLGYVRNNLEMIQSVFNELEAVFHAHRDLTGLLNDEDADGVTLAAQLLECETLSATLSEPGVLDDARALFDDSLFGVNTIAELVVNLRNFSRLDQSRLAEVSLNDCLDQTLTIANHLIRNRVEVVKQYGEVPLVRCSPSQINQVLLNLIGNAVQAIEHERGRLLLRTYADERWVHVLVQDNGRGIAAENIRKIFDPFFTTKPVGQGTGLGLSISYQIVRAHEGHIDVKSVPGRGTAFRVSLPVAAVAAQALTATG